MQKHILATSYEMAGSLQVCLPPQEWIELFFNHVTSSADNEWKTRCETQEELNQLLNKQIDYLRDRLDQSRDSAKDGFESDLRSYDELSEVSVRNA